MSKKKNCVYISHVINQMPFKSFHETLHMLSVVHYNDEDKEVATQKKLHSILFVIIHRLSKTEKVFYIFFFFNKKDIDIWMVGWGKEGKRGVGLGKESHRHTFAVSENKTNQHFLRRIKTKPHREHNTQERYRNGHFFFSFLRFLDGELIM